MPPGKLANGLFNHLCQAFLPSFSAIKLLRFGGRFDDAFTAVNGVSWEQFEERLLVNLTDLPHQVHFFHAIFVFQAWIGNLVIQPIHPRHRRDFLLLVSIDTILLKCYTACDTLTTEAVCPGSTSSKFDNRG